MTKLDERQLLTVRRIAGLVLAAITVFVASAMISYLFHWKEDMDLLNDTAASVENVSGTLGYKTGRLLIYSLFGLGSFSLVVFLAVVSVRLMIRRFNCSVIKTLGITATAAFIFSLTLAWAGEMAGIPLAFGGGLGGVCGAAAVAWSANMFGKYISGLFILVLLLCWGFFSSRRFSDWVSSLGSKALDKANEFGESQAEEETAEAEDEAVDIIEDEVIEEPEPVAVSQPAKVGEEENIAGVEIIRDEGLEAPVTRELEPIDNRMDPPEGLPKFKFPSLDFLKDHGRSRTEVSDEELTRNNNRIREALANYHIQINEVKAIVGPTVTLYKVYPAPGVQIAQIKRLQEDIALSLKANGVRVVTLNDSVGIEVANDSPSIVPLKALLNDDSFRKSKAELPVAIGYTITQQVKVFDLSDAPHLLLAGATKQGKSVGLNVIVSSLLYSKHPSELKFVFIDPKMVEFSSYANLLNHYLAVLPDSASDEEERQNAIVKKPKDAEKTLRSLCTEMDLRYEMLSEAGVNNLKLYNEKYKARKLRPDKGHRYLPYLVAVVDEYADLTMMTGASPEARSAAKSITQSIIRLAQKGRAAGIHVILATQRPSVDVISGIIKSNFPMRIAFRVASRVDSQTILDAPGAEKLIGRGDMLFYAGIDSERIQCAYISGDETDTLTRFIADQKGFGKSYNTPYYLPAPAEENGGGEEGGSIDMSKIDERFEEAARMVVTTQRGSTSDLQRKLGMGYAKAGRVMDQLEAAGIVGPQEGSKPRQVLIPDLNTLQPILDSFLK